ncbi:hypothetical protein ACQ4PT_049308 [Festuca glaucescens]
MSLPALFGVAGRILSRRICSQAPAALSRRTLAGARLLIHVRLPKPNLHSFNHYLQPTSCTDHKLNAAMAIASFSTVCGGIWHMSKNSIGHALDDQCYDDMVRSLRPSKIDWVEAGVVSPIVRNQYACGCCWAMAVVASVEALHNMKTKQSVLLSVQELIDCNTKNNGCQGGSPELALDYILVNRLSTESSNPYMARSIISSCKKDKTVAARVSGFRTVSLAEYALEEAVAKQPVIVSLQSSSSLQSYKGGIMDYEALPETLPDGSNTRWHGVLIVGYGTDPNGIKYWRFKNSWGEGGFGRIRRHIGDERGALGMFMHPAVYPVMDI